MEEALEKISAGLVGGNKRRDQRTLAESSNRIRSDEVLTKPLHSSLDFFGSYSGKESGSGHPEQAIVKKKRDRQDDESQETKPVALGVRKRYRIRTEAGLPEPMRSFEKWRLEKAFESVTGVLALTEIQSQAAPCMKQKYEVIAVAPTGSGKTLAYVVPVVKLAMNRKKPLGAAGCLILVPTKELAEQVARVTQRFLDAAKVDDQIKLKLVVSKAHVSGLAGGGSKRANIIVATPMRLIHAIRSRAVELSRVRDLILDEADKLFEDGFMDQLDEVLTATGGKKTRVHLFSATLPPKVEEIARTVMKTPVKIIVGGQSYGGGTAAVDASTVKQRFMFADGQGEAGKVAAFRRLLTEGLMPPTLVFVQSQDRASQLFKELVFDGVNIDAIHANRTAAQRSTAVENFRSGRVWILIATDLMARGIDFRTINTVVNYDLPASPIAYVHRIGRTGRAGRTGQAITFFTEDDKPLLRKIVNVAVASGAEVPKWMLDIKPGERVKASLQEKRQPRRDRIGTAKLSDVAFKRPNRKRKRQRANGVGTDDDADPSDADDHPNNEEVFQEDGDDE
uniref:RNA helicase n=2 Tax=Rhodosorus marinus TaxID=101924 RepID=A0A7S3A9B4_9RHOD